MIGSGSFGAHNHNKPTKVLGLGIPGGVRGGAMCPLWSTRITNATSDHLFVSGRTLQLSEPPHCGAQPRLDRVARAEAQRVTELARVARRRANIALAGRQVLDGRCRVEGVAYQVSELEHRDALAGAHIEDIEAWQPAAGWRTHPLFAPCLFLHIVRHGCTLGQRAAGMQACRMRGGFGHAHCSASVSSAVTTARAASIGSDRQAYFVGASSVLMID